MIAYCIASVHSFVPEKQDDVYDILSVLAIGTHIAKYLKNNNYIINILCQ